MLTIIKPGLLTSIQDIGRVGYQKYGVIASGAMDILAHRIANLLIGNEGNQATLEITLIGPVIKFEEDAFISLCGGDLSPEINGKQVRLWRPIFVKKGSQLSFGQTEFGSRIYLAVAGGFAVANVMESRSTYLRARIGGYFGRALRQGDHLEVNSPKLLSLKIWKQLEKQAGTYPFAEARWRTSSSLVPMHRNDWRIRVIKGRQFDQFSPDSKTKFFSEPFMVTPQSDRMGSRLSGPLLKLNTPKEMLSEAVSFGSIQVPVEGNPIVLLADRQTTGGYPKIAQISTVDLSLMAQAKPGDRLRFSEITHQEAQLLYLNREKQLDQLKHGISLKFLTRRN